MPAPYLKGRDRFYPHPEAEKDLPSVTTILSALAKPALMPWAAKQERELVKRLVAEEFGTKGAQFFEPFVKRLQETKLACYTKLDEAGEIGTAIHAAVECAIKGQPIPELGPEATTGFEAWKRWRDEVELDVLMCEQQVFSIKHGYAGTADLVCRANHDGERWLCIGDNKSSRDVYMEHALQIAAYREALREMGHFTDDVMHGIIVKIPKTIKDGTVRAAFFTSQELDEYLETFLAIQKTWVATKKWEKATKKR